MLLVIVVLLRSIAGAQIDPQLSASLLKHFVVVRNYYIEAQLTFDSNGKLTSTGTPGFGPNEGRIYVEDVRLEAGKLVIVGNRPIDVYAEKENRLQPTNFGRKVTLEIALPSGQAPKITIPAVMEKVFLTSGEIDKIKCSSDENKSFVERLQVSRDLNRKLPLPPKEPEARTIDELHTACYPIGDRAYWPKRGIKLPKPIKAPEPYSSGAVEHAHPAGTCVLLLIVDANGKPASFIISHPAGYGLDEAALESVRNWIFKPGAFLDQPVAVAMTVQVYFHQH